MEIPELAELISVFEDEPTSYDGEGWPVGLQAFRLRRGDREVLFSLDPISGEAYVSIFESGEEIVLLGSLRTLERVTVERRGEREGLVLHFVTGDLGSLRLQTRPVIHVSWDLRPPGVW